MLTYTGGSTSSMKNHLKGRHMKVNLKDSAPTQRQLTLAEVQKSKTKISETRYNTITKSLALACALDLRPISMVTGKGFRHFCSKLNPDYQVPCRTTVTRSLQLLYDEAKSDLITLLSGCDVSLTKDLWTSCTTVPYITFTGHFINENWSMYGKILATRPISGRHTGSNIASCVKEIKTEFSIRNISAIVTDNAKNMVVAADEANVIRWPCFSHTLQLAVEDGLKDKGITKALAFARKLVGHFKHSGTASIALKDRQVKDGVAKPLMVIQSVPTRWNSQYFMATRLLKLRIHIFAVLMDDKITDSKLRSSLDLPDASWKILEDIVPILAPFADATELLTKEEAPTLGQVYILLFQLVTQTLAANSEDSSTARNLRSNIKQSLMTRFQLRKDGVPKNLHSLAMVASFLDPRYKSLRMLSATERADVVTYVQGLIPDDVPPGDVPTDVKQEPEEQEAVVDISTGSIFQCLMGDVEIDLTTPGAIQEECDHYMAEPVRIADPLIWWKTNEPR